MIQIHFYSVLKFNSKYFTGPDRIMAFRYLLSHYAESRNFLSNEIYFTVLDALT